MMEDLIQSAVSELSLQLKNRFAKLFICSLIEKKELVVLTGARNREIRCQLRAAILGLRGALVALGSSHLKSKRVVLLNRLA